MLKAKINLQKFIWLSSMGTMNLLLSCSSGNLAKDDPGKVLSLKEARQTGSFEMVENTIDGIVAVQKGRIGSTLSWDLPAGALKGWYIFHFTGSSKFQPTAKEQRENEPYIISVNYPGHPLLKEQNSFAFKIPGDEDIELSGLPVPLLDPTPVQTWQSSEPFFFDGNAAQVELRVRRPLLITGDLTLQPVPAEERVHLTLLGNSPYHMFTDDKPVAFQYRIDNLSSKPFEGEIRFITLDALNAKRDTFHIPVRIDADSWHSDTLKWTPLYGAYRLTAETIDKKGKLLYRQHSYLTYGPYIDVRKLPDSWPVAFHRHPSHPMMIPPIGAKWVRTWWGGSLSKVETSDGSYDWTYMDEHVKFAKMYGYRLLSVTSGDPDKMKPFMEAFWKRYAPDGNAGVIGALEISNEPNVHPEEWTPERYTRLARIIYEETKKLTKGVKVVGISMSGGLHLDYMENILNAGLDKYMDVASLHLYETSNPVGKISMESKIRLFKEKLKAHGLGNMPVWDTESGSGTDIRQDGVIIPQEELNKIIRQDPDFDPAVPYRVGNDWRAASELLGTAYVIRASYQQFVMGVEKNFMYQWGGSPHHFWVYDYDPGGNPLPKIKVVAAAVMSKMLLAYGPHPAPEQPKVTGTDEMLAFAHRFEGPEGRMTIVYVQPANTNAGPGDQLAALASGDKTKTDPDNLRSIWLRTKKPDPVKVSVPVNASEVILTDMFEREYKTVKAINGQVEIEATEIPQYIIEKNPKEVR